MHRILRLAVLPVAAGLLSATALVVSAAEDEPSLVAPSHNATVCAAVTVPVPQVAEPDVLANHSVLINDYLERLEAARIDCILSLE